MPWVTIVDGGRDRRPGMDLMSSPRNETLISSNSHEHEDMFVSHQSSVTLMHTPRKSGSSTSWARLDHEEGDEEEETVSRSCFSPDSVMAWPAGEHDVSPVKRQLELKSPPTSPLAVSVDGDTPDVDKSGCVSDETCRPTLSVHRDVPDLDTSDFADAHDDACPTMPGDEQCPGVARRVSFADERGVPLVEVRELDPPLYQRMVLLLLSPNDRKFEFLHLEYPLDDNTTVQVVIDQVPKVSANPVFQRFTFSCLARTSRNEKLENNHLIGDCKLVENELLLGIPMGYAMTQIGACAVPLLLNGDIIKAVNRAKKSGRGLKTIKSGHEWRRRGKPRKIPKSWTRKPRPDDSGCISTLRLDHHADGKTSIGVDELESLSSTDQETVHWCPLVVPDEAEMCDIDTRTTESKSSLETNARSVVDQLISNEDEVPEMETEEAVSAAMDRNLDADQPSESTSLNSSMDKCSETVSDVRNPDCVYPDLVNDYLGEGTEKVVFWIHAVSIAAVGYLTSMALR